MSLLNLTIMFILLSLSTVLQRGVVVAVKIMPTIFHSGITGVFCAGR
jgi:hypothetical protein